MNHNKKLRDTFSSSFLIILFLGSLWGFSEVVLSSLIKLSGISFRAGILTGIGMGILAFSYGSIKKPYLLPVVALIAVFCKQMVVPLLGVSLTCSANSCLAVLLQSGVLTGILMITGKKEFKIPGKMIIGASAAFLSAAVFYPLGTGLAPCNYLLSFATAGGMSTFLIQEGVIWALFSGLLYPVGLALGSKFNDNKIISMQLHPVFNLTYWLCILLFWISSATMIISGQYDYLLGL